MGTQPVDEYCRDIETYLCRKNDGHLIRVVGPSFELVSGWAAQGIPLKVAYNGIDRYFERYYRKGPRRRPIRIDFCEADVLDVFDEWRRALGLTAATRPGLSTLDSGPSTLDSGPSTLDTGPSTLDSGPSTLDSGPSTLDSRLSTHRSSLPAHLERAVLRLTQARAGGSLGAAFDEVIDRVAGELDRTRADSRGVRGEARQALLRRLSALDAELVAQARATLDAEVRAAVTREAEADLAAFRSTMTPDAFARAREAAIDRLVRERFTLPTLVFP